MKGAVTDPHTQTHTGSHGSHQHIPAFFSSLSRRSSSVLCHFSLFVLVSTWLQSLCLLFPDSIHLFFVLSVFLFVFCLQTPAENQSTYRTAMWPSERVGLFRGSDSLHFICGDDCCQQNMPWTHKHTHTCSSVWENRDRSQPDLTIAQRKRSIKQQVHFSAVAFKKHGRHHTAGAL